MAQFQERFRYRRYYRHLRGFYRRKPVRDFTFLVLTLLTIAFFVFSAIRPSLKTIGGLMKEIKDKREASEKLEEKINALSRAQREYARLQPDLPIVYQALPQTSKPTLLAKQIEYLAMKENLFLLDVQMRSASLFGEEKKEVIPLEFSLNLGGEYENLKKFLENLEKLDRIITVEVIGFSEKKTGREELAFPLSLRITAKGYYLR